MALLPIRHPQKDFFVLDIADVVPKDDTASMEHPIFSLATKPDHRHLHYQNGENTLSIIPSGNGLPTIFDKDILIFCISQLIHKKNRGEPIGKRVRFSGRELLIATNRPTNNLGYKRLKDAFSRLRGTNFETNIRSGGRAETRIFGLIDEGGFVMKEDFSRVDYCEVVLSDWVMNAINASEVVTISNDYFRLRRPLERRLYEIGRKHCGNQKRWHISLDKLKAKTGSNAPLKKFRHNVKQIITEDNTPFYKLELTADDLVIFRPRKSKIELAPDLVIDDWAEDQAREIAHQKRWDYYHLRSRWMDFAKKEAAEGRPADNPSAAFIAWCQKQGNAP